MNVFYLTLTLIIYFDLYSFEDKCTIIYDFKYLFSLFYSIMKKLVVEEYLDEMGEKES